MPRQKFEPYPNTKGEIQENGVEILIDSPFKENIKRDLTAENRGASFLIQRLSKQRTFSIEEENDRLQKIEELKDEVQKEYYAELADGRLSVPIGFWYLCSGIKGTENTEISHVHLPSWLRDYQKADLRTLLKYKRALMSSATGLGKTMMIISLVLCAVKAKKRTCIIVPTIDLVRQTIESCKKCGIEKVSGAGGDFLFKPGSDVLVTTIDSAYKHIDIFDVIALDEVHHAAAKTWFNLLASAITATHVYGFSATPFRTDGLDVALHAWCGPVVTERTAHWGIQNGWLAKPLIFMIGISGLPFVSSKAPSPIAYRKLAADPKVQRVLLGKIKAALAAKRTVMVIFSTVKAGEAFKKYCKGQLEFDVAHAKFRVPFHAFKKGETNLLVGNVKLFGEGIDVPRVDCIITLCNNDSEIVTRQVIGRAMRIFEGKKDAIVLDFWFDSYEPYVRHYNHRKQVYETIDLVKEISA